MSKESAASDTQRFVSGDLWRRDANTVPEFRGLHNATNWKAANPSWHTTVLRQRRRAPQWIRHVYCVVQVFSKLQKSFWFLTRTRFSSLLLCTAEDQCCHVRTECRDTYPWHAKNDHWCSCAQRRTGVVGCAACCLATTSQPRNLTLS